MERLLNARIWSLIIKELNQIKRSRQLIISFIIPPTIQMIIFGFALNPTMSHMKLGVVDESRTVESREVVSALSENDAFDLQGYYASPDELSKALTEGELDAGMVIPVKFAEQLVRRETTEIQMLFNGLNTNTGTIAQGYAARIMAEYNLRKAASLRVSHAEAPLLVTPRVALLYNSGLISSWYIVSGVFGLLLMLNSSIVSASALTKEKAVGTVEQLLMTPASTTEIIIAKIAPLFLLLMLTVCLVLLVMVFIFSIPMRGSLALIFLASALCVLCGIGLGTFIATFTKNATQAQLLSILFNPPIAMLSGAMTPIEAMPEWIQPVTYRATHK
ncbi:MAG TPA: ABC transporter permease [Blastocatellia bacterium]|nr:ABC transporter permease [Blastocatellia bacterium]